MGIATLGGSSGLTTSDLITQPEWTLINSFQNTTAQTSFSFNSIPLTYKKLKVLGIKMRFSTNSDKLAMRVNNDSSTATYSQGGINHQFAGGSYGFDSITASQSNGCIVINEKSSVTTGGNLNFELDIEGYASSSSKKFYKLKSNYSSTYLHYEEHSGFINLTSSITSLNFISFNGNSSNIVSGSSDTFGVFLFGAK